jgi:hypothetical protein
MELSGTSFAAPVVAGAALDLLAVHPDWTPDQVKGALMLAAKPAGFAKGFQLGVGEVDIAAAVAKTAVPNPNIDLDQYLSSRSPGSVSFDDASWHALAGSDASWHTASWHTASWNTASWNTASWGSASWNQASWASASWASASWATASWNEISYEDAAEAEHISPPLPADSAAIADSLR